MNTPNPMISQHLLTEGSVLYSTALGNILIGCPPEILKVLMTRHMPMPDTIVIPGTLYKYTSSQACIEFPFYHFLFIQQGIARGKRFKVYAKRSICQKIEEMVRVTLLGPKFSEIQVVEKNLRIPERLDSKKVEQVIKEVDFLAPKNSQGKNYSMEEMIEFIPLEIGDRKTIYPSYKKHPKVTINRIGEDEFVLNCDIELNCRINITEPQSPVYDIKGVKVSKAENSSNSIFSVRCLGASEGFDPTQPANGFLLRFLGKWVLWDCPAFLSRHLESINLTLDQIDAIFVSHVHEDHLEIMESLGREKKLDIYTSPEIFHCMILKVLTILDCDYETALSYYNFHPIYVDEPFDLFGAMAEVFYSSHAIPALGLRLSVPFGEKMSKLFLSGDTLSQRMVNKLSETGVYSDSRFEEIKGFVPENPCYDISFVDAGGGSIHGDPEDYYEKPCKIFYMHTGKQLKGLPKDHRLLKHGQRFIIHK